MAGKTVKQLVGDGSGQSFMDRMNAAKYSMTGSGIAKVVCKATTEEMVAPKKKHLDYLMQCTFESNVSIPELANLLIVRTQQSNWVVVFKALITIHNTMNFGNERFSQYLSTNNCHLSLSNFTDRTGVQAFDMSKFVRQYSCYVEQKTKSYRDLGFDFCKIQRGKENGVLRKMSADKLMKSILILEAQLDSMLDFDANCSEINHTIVCGAFILLYKDAIRLFATYNDGMINLIEKYFSMNRKQCRDALNLYKNFIKRMDRVNNFLRLGEGIGCGDKDALELLPIPSSVLEALEDHLNHLDGSKVSEGVASSAFINSETYKAQFSLSDYEKQRIIEEEKSKLEEFATKRLHDANISVAKSEPSLNKITTHSSPGNVACKSSGTKPSDDLILLGLDPDPGVSTLNGIISTEVANIFGVSTNYSQSTTQPINDPFIINEAFTMNSNPAFYKEINFDFVFGGNSKLLNNEIDRINESDFVLNKSAPSSCNVVAPSVNSSPLSLDAKLASLAGTFDIGAPGTRSAQTNITSVNWTNSGRPVFDQKVSGQIKTDSINWNMTNSSGIMSPNNPCFGGYAPRMDNMTSYNQNYQAGMIMTRTPYSPISNCTAGNINTNPFGDSRGGGGVYGQQSSPQYNPYNQQPPYSTTSTRLPTFFQSSPNHPNNRF